MVANVGRLLETTFTLDAEHDVANFKVYKSVLNPGADGSICRKYFNVHHDLDPFMLPRPFRPRDAIGARGEDIRMTRVRDPRESHNFDHYFKDPNVHLPILSHITGKGGSLCDSIELTTAVEEFTNEFDWEGPSGLDKLRALLGGDPDAELSWADLAVFLYGATKELLPCLT
jgi:hypothetical protein